MARQVPCLLSIGRERRTRDRDGWTSPSESRDDVDLAGALSPTAYETGEDTGCDTCRTLNPALTSRRREGAHRGVIVLASLKEREAKILRLYFGLDGEEAMTLEQIGALLGITRERVRQIKEKALSRLRHVSRARALESFLG